MRIIDICFFTAILITYIKGGTPAQIFLEKGFAMTRATFVFFYRSYKVLLTDVVIILRWAELLVKVAYPPIVDVKPNDMTTVYTTMKGCVEMCTKACQQTLDSDLWPAAIRYSTTSEMVKHLRIQISNITSWRLSHVVLFHSMHWQTLEWWWFIRPSCWVWDICFMHSRTNAIR